MKMLEDGGHTLNPLQLLYQIKRAKATTGQTGITMPMAPPALTTIGEANSKAGTSPAMMWVGLIFILSLSIGSTSALTYTLYNHPFFSGRSWCLLALILWGVYMAVVAVVMVYMTLFLPNAPVALREALVDIGWIYVGSPVMAIDIILVFLGQPWMVITMFYSLGVLIAGVLAFWWWLARTYRKCA